MRQIGFFLDTRPKKISTHQLREERRFLWFFLISKELVQIVLKL